MGIPINFTTCECGKRGYYSKRAAKRELRSRSVQSLGISVYRCRVNGELWHQGHLPSFVKEGRMTRETLAPARRTPKRRRGSPGE